MTLGSSVVGEERKGEEQGDEGEGEEGVDGVLVYFYSTNENCTRQKV